MSTQALSVHAITPELVQVLEKEILKLLLANHIIIILLLDKTGEKIKLTETPLS